MALPDLGGFTGFGIPSRSPVPPPYYPGGAPTATAAVPSYKGPLSIARPGFTPDYASLIQSDPGVLALKAALAGQDSTSATARAAATNRALIGYGYVPDFSAVGAKLGLSADQLSMLTGDIGSATSGLAGDNTAAGLSTEAKLGHAHDQAQLQIKNALAARGALSSGEAPYQLGNEQTSYTQAESDAVNQLLDAITGYQSSYVQGKQTAASQLAQALATAETTQAGLPQNQPVPAQSFHYDASTGKYSGGGVTYTPHQVGNGWVVVNDQSGDAFSLNGDGTIGDKTTYTAPSQPSGGGGSAGTPAFPKSVTDDIPKSVSGSFAYTPTKKAAPAPTHSYAGRALL